MMRSWMNEFSLASMSMKFLDMSIGNVKASSRGFACFLLLFAFFSSNLAVSNASAASKELEPLLKAIDPSQAKMDETVAQPEPSPSSQSVNHPLSQFGAAYARGAPPQSNSPGYAAWPAQGMPSQSMPVQGMPIGRTAPGFAGGSAWTGQGQNSYNPTQGNSPNQFNPGNYPPQYQQQNQAPYQAPYQSPNQFQQQYMNQPQGANSQPRPAQMPYQNQYQPQYQTQYQPQYQPQYQNQYQPQPQNQYQPQYQTQYQHQYQPQYQNQSQFRSPVPMQGMPGGMPPQAQPGQAPGGYHGGMSSSAQPVSPAAAGKKSGFPSESMLPNFGQPLPSNFSRHGAGQAWTAGAPASLVRSGSDLENRVTQLENIAFGSTYPEHDLEDRLDHLEKEVFGAKSSSSPADRLSKLESKLGSGSGGGAFESLNPDMKKNPTGNRSSVIAPETIADKSFTDKPIATAVPADSPISDSTEGNEDTARVSIDDEPGIVSFEAGSEQTASAIASALPVDEKSGDYLTAIRNFPGDCYARWDSFPVRIRLPQPAGKDSALIQTMEKSIAKWNRLIPLKSVDRRQAADIEVVWVDHLSPKLLGVTRMSIHSGHMKMRVFMLRPDFYQPSVSARVFDAAFMHELGHALGLLGHSPHKGDLMQPLEVLAGGKGRTSHDKISTPSSRDIATLKKIYQASAIGRHTTLDTPLEWSFEHLP